MRIRTLAALAATALLAAGCSNAAGRSTQPQPSAHATNGQPAAQLPWDRPANQQARVKAAGLNLTPEETLAVHYHAHLDVFVNGQRVPVPAGLGINAGPNGELPEHGAPGIAPLHTHDTSGILHIEAPKQATFTLGQVFDELTAARVRRREGVRQGPERDRAQVPRGDRRRGRQRRRQGAVELPLPARRLSRASGRADA